MDPYQEMLRVWGCNSFPELHLKVWAHAKDKMGIDELPFTVYDLENPTENMREIIPFMIQCHKLASGDNSDAQAKELIEFLKKNPPKESYENPKVPDSECTKDEKRLIKHIFNWGIDLPGSKHNPHGLLQNFSSFFIDMFFGNYTEFINHVRGLSKDDLKKALRKREGYCQLSPIFAPILGLNMIDLDFNSFNSKIEKEDIRFMYSGNNENKHLEILKKLIKKGADVNAFTIHGYTPLHYAARYRNLGMVSVLLKNGANPNSESRNGRPPLTSVSGASTEICFPIISEFLQYNAKLTNKEDINEIRSNVETYGDGDLAVRVREAFPRDKNECEKCVLPASKECGACGLVKYCTPACQKLDWKFHKVTCQRNKKD